MLRADGDSYVPKERRSCSFNDQALIKNKSIRRLQEERNKIHYNPMQDNIEPKITKKRKNIVLITVDNTEGLEKLKAENLVKESN